MMELVELCGRHECMPKVSLTVFKANLSAIRFYAKLGYLVDSAIDPNGEDDDEDGGGDCDYFILSKPLVAGGPPQARFSSTLLTKFLEKYKEVR